ncbi:MAG: hypothetical protein EXX96DRAFT_549435, partial [Benjaminiella poitrasii]
TIKLLCHAYAGGIISLKSTSIIANLWLNYHQFKKDNEMKWILYTYTFAVFSTPIFMQNSSKATSAITTG